MKFLPIAERELRVATRRAATYRLRVFAALVGLIIGAGVMVIHTLGGSSAFRLGATLFDILTWLGFAASLLAGVFFTSDCISQEKRQGTLGFLFLTDLRGVDVIFGKLAATSLRGVYAVLSILPVLALTLLMGGVGGGQFWRTSLALLNALSCSLAAGIFVSTVSRKSQNAVTGTFLLLLVWLGLGPLADLVWREIRGRPGFTLLSYLSPGYPFIIAGHGSAKNYLCGVLGSIAVTGLLLVVASWLVRNTWQERDKESHQTRVGRHRDATLHPRRAALRKGLIDTNPALWLAGREGSHARGAWLLSILAFCIATLFLVLGVPTVGWAAWSAYSGLLVLLLYLWTASQASRFFVEARLNGIAELLLITPLTVAQVLDGQWRWLVRTLGPPAVVFLLVQSVVTIFGFRLTSTMLGSQAVTPFVQVLLAVAASILGFVSTLANLAALGWFGMWNGLTSKSSNQAALKTILFVQIVPWFAISFASSIGTMLVLMPVLMRAGGTVNFAVPTFWMSLVAVAVPSSLSVVKDMFFIFWARSRLYSQLRDRVANPFGFNPRVPPRYPAVPVSPVLAPPVIRQNRARELQSAANQTPTRP